MSKFRKVTKPEHEEVMSTTNVEALMGSMDSIVSPMMPPVYNNAIGLTKLIIENRLRKGEEFDEEDIYKIHRESFMNCMPDKIDPKYSEYEEDYDD